MSRPLKYPIKLLKVITRKTSRKRYIFKNLYNTDKKLTGAGCVGASFASFAARRALVNMKTHY